ncbi:MAG: 7-cyano-7-deazaguanine synthase QueC [Pseudomonadota bacterium]|jgi:7-cyano-7-deazaguanine synthase|nr:7-cyano-7-deazaguanine synthase QueC [Burkholderiales bacterium]
MKAILILSGGLDSSTLGYYLKANNYSELICLTFDYGQKHIKEINSAKIIAEKLNAEHRLIELSLLKPILKGSNSSLTNAAVAVPHGAYTKENMASTVVPNRNAMMLTLAWTIACVEEADVLAYGAHAGDHYIYPDTRPDFFTAINNALRLGTEDLNAKNLNLIAPFINKTKSEIVTIGANLNVPFALTWTCYEGGDIHCGLCGACHGRKDAFFQANIKDPTIYRN